MMHHPLAFHLFHLILGIIRLDSDTCTTVNVETAEQDQEAVADQYTEEGPVPESEQAGGDEVTNQSPTLSLKASPGALL